MSAIDKVPITVVDTSEAFDALPPVEQATHRYVQAQMAFVKAAQQLVDSAVALRTAATRETLAGNTTCISVQEDVLALAIAATRA